MSGMRVVAAFLVLASASVAVADPERDALAHLDRGIAAYRLADYATARTELGAAIELVPDRANPYRWRALVEERQHDCSNALVDVESFLSRAPAGDARVAEMTALRERCVHVAAVTAPSSPAPPGSPPIYERWWFWTAVGAVVVTSVAIAIAATRESTATLPVVHCDAAGCHP
ncbi:hypothetical protein BH11MYX1_BH11MYX1_13750 [soil metagenome]